MTTEHANDGYATGDPVSEDHEPGNGAIVLAQYRSNNGDNFEIVWRREDLGNGQKNGNWFEIRASAAFCTHCGTTRTLGASGPSSWGEVLGLDDPEPYAFGHVILWPGGERAFWW